MMSIHQRLFKIIALSFVLLSCDSERSQSDESDKPEEAPSLVILKPTEETEANVLSAKEAEVTQVNSGDSHGESAQQESSSSASEIKPTEEKNENVVTQMSESSKPFCLGQGTSNTDVVRSACLDISNRLASVTNEGCLAAKLMLSQCESVQRFPILYSEFSPLNGKQAQGKVLVIGGTHGDELTSVSMVFRWIEKLNRFHTGLFHWHMVPMMNPDGVLKSGATRTNANGVDLNRNLPSDDWQQNALKYWDEKTDKSERRYPGEYPASEPETQWLIDEIKSFNPDAIIAVHAPYGLVDFDAPVLNTAPKSLGRLMLNILGTYPGSLGNYAGINLNIPVITLELPHAWVMPSDSETTKLWEDIVKWLRNNLDNPTPTESIADSAENFQKT